MSYMFPDSPNNLEMPPQDVEELGFGPYNDLELPGALSGGSGLEANGLYDQVEILAYPWAQYVPQPSFSSYETNVSQGHPHGPGGDLIMQGTGDGDSRGAHPKPRPFCPTCGKYFGRVQERNRHVVEQHQPPRKCPFCYFKWARPANIKAHILAEHRDILPIDVLNHVGTLCGRQLLEFLKLFHHRGFNADETLTHGCPTPGPGYFPS
ncbi:hypothetical protein BJV74DRAFT_799010 [Russula compacta]|nr:hypothetical protein BJV74DRAFT_799010 [Russula compacta]